MLQLDVNRLISIAQARVNANGNGKEPQDETAKTWLPIADAMTALERGEIGDAELLAKLCAGRIAFDHAKGEWHTWAGHHWQGDKTRFVVNLVANDVAAQFLLAAAERQQAGDNDAVDKLKKRAQALRARHRIVNVLDLAATLPGLALTGNEWDADPMLFGVANGVLNLDAKNFEFRDGAPGDYIRTNAPTEWRKLDEPAPRWEQFLQEIFAGDDDLISFVQRLLGYALAGISIEAIFPVLWGEGRNGKDTLLEVLAHVLGEYAAPVAADVLLETKHGGRGPTPELYDLRQRRIVWVNETNEGARLNAGQVKWLTGGGTIAARPLYGKPITFRPRYLLMLVTNHKPHANADDYALWKRLLLIPFTQSFVDDPHEPHEHERDPRLKEILKTESPGILAWLVRGCLDWQRSGLNPPAAVRAATADYQSEEDTVGEFIAARCVVLATAQTPAGALYAAYKQWAEESGYSPMTVTAFGRRMARKFKRRDGMNRVYFGIGLREE